MGKSKLKPSFSDRGVLIRHGSTMVNSTRGLYLSNVRNQKMTGGIFEIIRLKRKLDGLQDNILVATGTDLQQQQQDQQERWNEEYIIIDNDNEGL